MSGFIKLMRTEEARELCRHPNELAMLHYIAQHARYTDSDVLGLKKGECVLSRERCGLTSREYRTAKQNLAKRQLADFRATNKGTIAKLRGDCIFSIFAEGERQANDKQATSKRQASDKQTTSSASSKRPLTKNDKKEDNERVNNDNIFLKIFNEEKKKVSPKSNGHKALTPGASKSLKSILKNYSMDEVKIATVNMLQSEWPRKTGNQTPTHLLRPDNFERYLNKQTSIMDQTPKITDQPEWKT